MPTPLTYLVKISAPEEQGAHKGKISGERKIMVYPWGFDKTMVQPDG